VEPLSLDEAYLDVSGLERCQGSASLMAEEIRARIRAEVRITASAGIAPNKFLAKVASDWRKPDGQFVVHPRDVAAFVAALPVGKIFGVGKVTAARQRPEGRGGTNGSSNREPEEALMAGLSHRKSGKQR
jgi:DNA polymerase-4